MPDDIERDLEICAAASPPEDWKPHNVGIYEDPFDDDDLCFARGPMVLRKAGESVEQWKRQALADAAFAARARERWPIALVELRDLNKVVDHIDQTIAEHLPEYKVEDDTCSPVTDCFDRIELAGAEIKRLRAALEDIKRTVLDSRAPGSGGLPAAWVASIAYRCEDALDMREVIAQQGDDG